jgi:hypothetical protein
LSHINLVLSGVLFLFFVALTSCSPSSANQIAFRQEDSNQFGSLWLATSDGTHKYQPVNWLGFMFGSPKWLNQRELYVNVNESSTKWGDYILTDLEKGYLGCVTCEITGIMHLRLKGTF